ncbi:MAG TPA: Gfo/Idh/MocA family oxidoreductase [Steroidobacter sp.]|jgi:predicted dehydrogenase|nr:Gfo/Idh/MocA family oxidoreductase [Steroidobacteraceae bacterium]HLS81758.1 Gfo/Idh/MocA family oxidoreductase [Steroidobacter sp.]
MSAARLALRRARDAPRLGFLGLGWIGRKRLEAVSPSGAIVAALADCDAARLRAAAEAHPHAKMVANLDELLACDLDGVVIATPNALHARQTIACLRRGLAVFCQKPLAVSASETRAVLDAAQSADRLLGVDLCYRYVQGMSELRRLIRGDELGDILAIELAFHNAYGPDKAWAYDRTLSGGGCLLDLGVHLLDLALWLQDGPEMTLTGRGLFSCGAILDPRSATVEDMALAEFVQPGGAVVRLACSWNAHAGCDAVIGMHIFAARGGARFSNVNGSFYDFTLDVFRGRSAQRIGAPPDDWGARALTAWIDRLRNDRSFDPEALLVERGARLIDEIYGSCDGPTTL